MATEHQPTMLERIREHRLAITGAASTVMLTGAASAGTIADNVTPILDDVVQLMPTLLELFISAIPIIIAGAVITFVLGLLAAILGYIKL